MHPHTATVCYVRSLLPVVSAQGLTEGEFLARLGIDRRTLDDVDARIPKEAVASAWEIAAELTGNASVGLLASLHAPPGTFPVLDHIAANLPTVEAALRSIARYCRLCDPELAMRYDSTRQGGSITLVFPRNDRRYSRHWAEWFIGLIVSRVRTLGQSPDARPVSVKFQHGRPTDDDSLRSVLGCVPAFSGSTTAIAFDHATLALPIQNASAFLSRVILQHAERDLRRAAAGGSFSDRVEHALIDLLDREAPRLTSVARQVRCSVRTLQARLEREGTSYQRLLDEVRRQLAIQYVEDDSIRLMEISLLLKFAEPSPFHRAFKRWTGKTPLEYRQARAARPPIPAATGLEKPLGAQQHPLHLTRKYRASPA